MSKPVILFFDCETSPITATTWTLYPKYLSHENIIEDWYIICAAWKELNDKQVSSVAITKPGDDYVVCKKLRAALAKADVLIGHNLNSFDVKKLNARLIFHKLPPLPLIPTVDTLREIKKVAAFTSNRLDYLAKTLVGKGKLKTDFSLWRDVMNGSKAALKKMVDYCKVDVIRLQQIYERLRPYFKTHIHLGVLSGEDRTSCPKCGSTHTKRNGVRVTAAGLKCAEYQCTDCGGYFRLPIVKL